MECVFCKSDKGSTKAIHLDLDFPLCQTCLEVRDFMQEYNVEKQEGQGPIEWAQEYLSFAQTDGANA